MEETKFEVSQSVVNKLFAYLGKRPYVEVADLIETFRSNLDENARAKETKKEASKGKK